jgi:hypothetical protein
LEGAISPFSLHELAAFRALSAVVSLDDIHARIVSRIDGGREKDQITGLGKYGIRSDSVYPADMAWMRHQGKAQVEDRQLALVNIFGIREYHCV